MSVGALITTIVLMVAGILIAFELGVSLLENKVGKEQELDRRSKARYSASPPPATPEGAEMFLRYEITTDDLIDDYRRRVARSKRARDWTWWDRIAFSVRSGVFTGLPLYFIFRIVPQAGFGLLVAGAFGAYAFVTALMSYPALRKARIESVLSKSHKETHGSLMPVTCDLELSSVGLGLRQLNAQTTIEWEGVEEVISTPDSIDVATKGGSYIVLRNKAFASKAEKQRFFDLANGYIELSRPRT
jgi:hypothetical protein